MAQIEDSIYYMDNPINIWVEKLENELVVESIKLEPYCQEIS